ncbi:uncharacterized protein CLUP02_10986 [Colletotrichum lupini]|uniref:Yhl026c-like protein n=1 Tax=Colletotrichum lupini TaxID=145971 RepID=A0A9Q8SYC7_9PEZI|nr:uncharacterized protein CLUP02_10986 [Colletotrichum lupini]UQC85488.1 hypothetical protein CLUP02_10986 [Colletotrichum lupini]
MPFRKHERITDKSFEENTASTYAGGSSHERISNERVSNESDIEAGVQVEPSGSHQKQPTDSISGHQIFYIFGLDGIGAAFLSGGINFAIAYGMYSTQNIARNPIRLFQLPNTLAGDAVVTMIIQTTMTWFIELFLANRDMKNGSVRPIGFIEEPSQPFMRWFMMLNLEDTRHTKSRLSVFAEHLIRIGLIFVVSFFLLWPASVGILTVIGTRGSGNDWDWYFQSKWAPEAFKGILGGLLALLTTPAMASFWLVKEGWSLKKGGNLLS